MQATNQDDFHLNSRESLNKKGSEDIQENAVAAILFSCALISILTTFGIVFIIFQVAFEFFKKFLSLISFWILSGLLYLQKDILAFGR